MDKGFDEFKKSLGASADVDWILGTAQANFNQDYYEKHEKEIRQRLETRLKESYKNTTYTQYPEKLIDAIASCHKSCLEGTGVNCTAIPTDQNTVVFDVFYHRSSTINDTPIVKFTKDIVLPKGVLYAQDKSPRIRVAGQRLQVGPNLFQLDRSGYPGAFTVTCANSLKECTDSVADKAKEPAVPQYVTFCEEDAGFASAIRKQLSKSLT